MVSDCRWSLLTLIGCCQQWQQVSDTVANDRTLLTARGQAFLPLAGQRLRVLPVRITRRNGQCLKLEGLAVHVNCATKRGQAFLRVAGRSVTSSELVSGHKTCHKRTSKAGTLNREYSHAPLNDVSVNDVPHIRRLAHKIIYIFFFPLWRCGTTRATASSFVRFLDHTQRRITVGGTPVNEWSARRRDLYLKKHNSHNRQTSMPLVGFEPTISAGERPQTYALDRAATGNRLASPLTSS